MVFSYICSNYTRCIIKSLTSIAVRRDHSLVAGATGVGTGDGAGRRIAVVGVERRATEVAFQRRQARQKAGDQSQTDKDHHVDTRVLCPLHDRELGEC